MRADSSSLSSWWMEGAASCCAVLVDLRCVDDDCFGELEVAVNAADTATESATETDTESATETDTELHKWAAVKSPLGAQTVLGDRHDPDYENLFTSAVGRLRNSPERTFQRLGTHTEARLI